MSGDQIDQITCDNTQCNTVHAVAWEVLKTHKLHNFSLSV